MTEEEQENWKMVHYRMNNEGFNYCFHNYSRFEEIEDEKFHELRLRYLDVSSELEAYINKKHKEANENDHL